VQCALSTADTWTVSFQVYLNVLQNNFKPFLMGYGADTEMAWFQKDGTRPHTDGNALGLFMEIFGNTVRINRFPRVHGEGFERKTL
jgi:hypothetical protein